MTGHWQRVGARRVYIAAASAEVTRAERATAAAQAAGLQVVSAWPGRVRAASGGNPSEASASERRRWALADLAELERADVLWLLWPAARTVGAFIEFGWALARGQPVVVSGAGAARLVFTSLAARIVDTESEALAALLAVVADDGAPDDGGGAPGPEQDEREELLAALETLVDQLTGTELEALCEVAGSWAQGHRSVGAAPEDVKQSSQATRGPGRPPRNGGRSVAAAEVTEERSCGMATLDFCRGCGVDFDAGDAGCVECGACESCSPSPAGRVEGRCASCAGEPSPDSVAAFCPACLEEREGDPGCASCGACEGCSPSPLGRVRGSCWSCAGDPALSVAQVKERIEEAQSDG